jgi:hypothetical protein
MDWNEEGKRQQTLNLLDGFSVAEIYTLTVSSSGWGLDTACKNLSTSLDTITP